jgi:hypothetical protein
VPGAVYARRRAIADREFGSGTPTTWYCMLFTTLPGDDGTGGVEVSGGGYVRPGIANNATNFPAASTSGGVTTKVNGVKVTFPDPTADWGKIVGWGWTDVGTGGAPIYINRFTGGTEYTVKASLTVVEFDVGQLILRW